MMEYHMMNYGPIHEFQSSGTLSSNLSLIPRCQVVSYFNIYNFLAFNYAYSVLWAHLTLLQFELSASLDRSSLPTGSPQSTGDFLVLLSHRPPSSHCR